MKQKIGHGGSRSGAGRKELLAPCSRLHVGARAENLAIKIAKRRAHQKFADNPHHRKLAGRQRLALEALRENGSKWWDTSEGAQLIRDDIEFDIAELSGDPLAESPSRTFFVPYPRHNQRQYVLAAISRWASWRYKARITPRYVRECWKEYIKFLAET